MVGDLVGRGAAQEQAVVGETPNLAARLQALAEPGSVVIAESTRRLLGGTFELKALGPQTLKGFDAPVPAWAVLREAENVSRFEASRSQGMTPFVGREQEVALLLRPLARRDRGRGPGRAALGRGRHRQVAHSGGVARADRRRAACDDALSMLAAPRQRRLLSHRRAKSGTRRASSAASRAAARLDKLEAMIARSGLDAKDIAPLLAALLSIPFEGRYPALEMAPSEQKERTIAALIALFEGLTKDAPVLALLEDAHWIDPTSLDVFSRLVDRLPESARAAGDHLPTGVRGALGRPRRTWPRFRSTASGVVRRWR